MINLLICITFVYIGIPLLEGTGTLIGQFFEMIKGKIIIKTAKYNKEIRLIEDSIDDNRETKSVIGFQMEEGDIEEYEDLEDN